MTDMGLVVDGRRRPHGPDADPAIHAMPRA